MTEDNPFLGEKIGYKDAGEYQLPKTVKHDAAIADNIVSSGGWIDLEAKSEQQQDPVVELIVDYYSLWESANRGEKNAEASERVAKNAALLYGVKLEGLVSKGAGFLVRAGVESAAKSIRGLEHPFLHGSERQIAKLWFGSRFDHNIDMEGIYHRVTEKGAGYSEIHKRNTARLPEGFVADWESAVDLGRGMYFPVQDIERGLFNVDNEWKSNDRRKREEEAVRIADYVGENSERFGGPEARMVILDIGGGNGEGSHLIAQQEKLPENAVVVVRELSPGMISEGKAKIKALGLEEKVVFMEGDAQEPLDRDRLEELVPGYGSAPVAAVVSSYNVGAMPKDVAVNAMRQAYEDAAPGALVTVYDFADPDVSAETKENFLSSTGKAGEVFDKSRPSLGKALNRCYENWRHDPKNGEHVARALEEMHPTEISEEWDVTVFTIVPMMAASGDKVKSMVIPGFAQRTTRCVKAN